MDIPNDSIIERTTLRFLDPVSGERYHVLFNPPKTEGVDDETAEPLIQRDDDKEETVRKRLTVYHEQTKPLVDFYSDPAHHAKFASISGVGTVNEITERVFAVLN